MSRLVTHIYSIYVDKAQEISISRCFYVFQNFDNSKILLLVDIIISMLHYGAMVTFSMFWNMFNDACFYFQLIYIHCIITICDNLYEPH